MKPCVLLISPGILRWADMDFGLPHLVSLGGWLREHTGVRVEIVDLNYEGGDHHDLGRTLDALGPFLMIGLSCYSSFDVMRVMAVARWLKARYPDVPLVTGGYHASALPGDLVFDGSPFDAVVLGEGELPMQQMVESLLGGGAIDRPIWPQQLVQDLDRLPPYQWDLLDRYWPHAHRIGRKLQVYLSRGCPYRCSFCMERAKSGYQWRAYSSGRAVEELRRLSTYTDLSRWVVNLADPLFGFRRRWRREVLEGILRHDLLPRQYWTLTRSDDLDEDDIRLLADARFSIGIGLESGSPEMLVRMQKGNRPERYLDAVRRLARLSHAHGLTWAVNVIVGHPGETPESLAETAAYVRGLFAGEQTRGWLSVDPFRLYPGSLIHETMDRQTAELGTVFHHPRWWTSWYDGAFRAQHLEPGRALSYEERVRFQFDTYGPLVRDIAARFVGQGRDIDAVYRRSLDEQVESLSPGRRDGLIARGRTAVGRAATRAPAVPLGLHLKDPWVRRREEAVRRLLDVGALRSDDLVEALLTVAPERHMPPDHAAAMLDDRPIAPDVEGEPPIALPFRAVALGLEALEPRPGDRAADLLARSGYVAALLSELVGPRGSVDAFASPLEASGAFDRVWLGAAVPRFPWPERIADGGRAVGFVGPRFRAQDLVSLERTGETVAERVVTRIRIPIFAGPGGWLAAPRTRAHGGVTFARRHATALCFQVLAHLPIADVSGLPDPSRPSRPWADRLLRAWQAAPDRLAVQAVALRHDELEPLVADLRRSLREPQGAELAEALATALRAEALDPDPEAEARLVRTRAAIGETLAGLREALWGASGRVAPPLVVLDVPALGRRARATGRAARIVATSLAEPPAHVLCQVLHEEMHPITDPIVLAEHPGRPDTVPGSTGFALHQLIEHTALEATAAFLAARAPALVRDFERWRAGLR